MPVTRVLRIDPSYFGWCKNNVRWFKFSKRDYEIYLEWLSLQQNHLQFTGYSDDMGNIRFLLEKWKKASLMLTLIRNILQKKRVVNI